MRSEVGLLRLPCRRRVNRGSLPFAVMFVPAGIGVKERWRDFFALNRWLWEQEWNRSAFTQQWHLVVSGIGNVAVLSNVLTVFESNVKRKELSARHYCKKRSIKIFTTHRSGAVDKQLSFPSVCVQAETQLEWRGQSRQREQLLACRTTDRLIDRGNKEWANTANFFCFPQRKWTWKSWSQQQRRTSAMTKLVEPCKNHHKRTYCLGPFRKHALKFAVWKL